MKWVRQRCQLAPANTAAIVLQPLVSGGYQLHPAEAPSGQRPQEGQPERAVLAGAHVHTQAIDVATTTQTSMRPPSRTFWVRPSSQT